MVLVFYVCAACCWLWDVGCGFKCVLVPKVRMGKYHTPLILVHLLSLLAQETFENLSLRLGIIIRNCEFCH